MVSSDTFDTHIIKENIEKKPDESSYVAMLSYAKPSSELYDLLVEIYINSNDEMIRNSAVNGILYNKQFINDPYSFKEIMRVSVIRKLFDKKSKEERKRVIEQLQTGELDHYNTNFPVTN